MALAHLHLRDFQSELILRILSALVLGAGVLVLTHIGGSLFILLWMGAAMLVFLEWVHVSNPATRLSTRLSGVVMCALMAAVLMWGLVVPACAILCAGTVWLSLLAKEQQRLNIGIGALYSGAVLLAPVVLRADEAYGETVLYWLFAIVWMTDTSAFFIGKLLGGPKLWPSVSPGKTWSGAIGGLLGGTAGASVLMFLLGYDISLLLVIMAFVLSVVAQAGDLAESAFKRRFGVKNSGHLIPGHGGVMDRLDSFIGVAACAAVIGSLHQSAFSAAQGVLIWL